MIESIGYERIFSWGFTIGILFTLFVVTYIIMCVSLVENNRYGKYLRVTNQTQRFEEFKHKERVEKL